MNTEYASHFSVCSAAESTAELKKPKANYAWPVVGDTFSALYNIYSLLRKRTDELGPVCVISQLGEKTVLLKNLATMRKLLQKEHVLVESEFLWKMVRKPWRKQVRTSE